MGQELNRNEEELQRPKMERKNSLELEENDS